MGKMHRGDELQLLAEHAALEDCIRFLNEDWPASTGLRNERFWFLLMYTKIIWRGPFPKTYFEDV